MHEKQIAGKFEELRSRLSRIQGESNDTPGQQKQLLDIAFEDLHTSIEELQVLDEELHHQNEELALARTEIEAEKQRYSDLFHFAPDGYLITDKNGTIQEANRASSQMLNIQEDFLVGKPLIVFISQKDRTVFRKHLSQIISLQPGKGAAVPSELEIQLKPRGRPAFAAGIIVTAHEQQSTGADIVHPYTLRWLIRDVTERKQALEDLRESEERFHKIFDEANLGIHLFDLEGGFVVTNPAFQEMLGYSEGEFQHFSIIDLTYPDDVQQCLDLLEDLEAGKYDRDNIEKRFVHKNGEVVWVRQAVSLFQSRGGQPLYAIGLIENITGQKQLESELAEVQRRLIDNIEAERQQFAKELHDGPVQDLFGIFYQLSQLVSDLDDESKTEQLKSALLSLKQVIEVLRSTYHELRPPSLVSFGLEQAIRSDAERFQLSHPEIHFDLNLSEEGQVLPQRIRLALFRIYQYVLGYISRHSQARNVTIHLSISEKMIGMEIRDDGKGFEVPERWIELAQLGYFSLARAAERAFAIGARFAIQSSPDEGTVIQVSVPRLAANQVASSDNLSIYIDDANS